MNEKFGCPEEVLKIEKEFGECLDKTNIPLKQLKDVLAFLNSKEESENRDLPEMFFK
ncbi:MAG: hypothetical protein WC578_06280 [Candidatus Omnitrophota bacterium]|jgi:hypothetical protein